MLKYGHFCHSVYGLFIVFGVVFSSGAKAEGPACAHLFDSQARFTKEIFTQSDLGMTALKEGLLKELRTSDTARDHIAYFAEQIPLLLVKLEVKFGDAEAILLKHDPRNPTFESRKKSLALDIKTAHDRLFAEAQERVVTKTVTYEWYMDYFLKTLIFSDVTLSVVKNPSLSNLGVLTNQLNTLNGNSKVFYSGTSEITVFSTLSKGFATMTKNNYFARHLPENAIVPVLFKPKNSDIIDAEQMGLRLLSLKGIEEASALKKTSVLEEASVQIQQIQKQIQNAKDLTLQVKWLKYHNKILEMIRGDAALESLYVFVIKDAGLQAELARRFHAPTVVTEVIPTQGRIYRGHRVVVTPSSKTTQTVVYGGESHQASVYLAQYFRQNQSEVQKIATPQTIDAFLKVIRHIE